MNGTQSLVLPNKYTTIADLPIIFSPYQNIYPRDDVCVTNCTWDEIKKLEEDFKTNGVRVFCNSAFYVGDMPDNFGWCENITLDELKTRLKKGAALRLGGDERNIKVESGTSFPYWNSLDSLRESEIISIDDFKSRLLKFTAPQTVRQTQRLDLSTPPFPYDLKADGLPRLTPPLVGDEEGRLKAEPPSP